MVKFHWLNSKTHEPITNIDMILEHLPRIGEIVSFGLSYKYQITNIEHGISLENYTTNQDIKIYLRPYP